ncbi:hypothetical protein Psm1vBMR14_gp45 [Pseudomonas phage MR14]|nr:hypothetical protein Psm1vBMR14_gp45 [Pseudomonas phage MR14]
MTEEQRRALFALREALRLCEAARVSIWANTVPSISVFLTHYSEACQDLTASDINRLLSEHPE